MSVALNIQGTSQPARLIVLRAGQVATIGRSLWADISLPSETDLADEHLRLDCSGSTCRVESLGGTILRNGVKSDTSALDDGDTLTAGSVVIRVRIAGLTHPRSITEPRSISSERSQDLDAFTEIVSRAGLTDPGLDSICIGNRLETFDTLVSEGHHKDACRWGVACLGRVAAMQWAAAQVDIREVLLPDTIENLLIAVEHTNKGPTAEELDRRIASFSPSEPLAWLWKAARWSGGSLAGTGLPPVPPAPHLFALAISVAVSLAAAQQNQKTFLDSMTALRELIVRLPSLQSEVLPFDDSGPLSVRHTGTAINLEAKTKP